MHKANITFSTVEFVLTWLRQIDNCSQFFLENTNSSSPVIEAIRNYTAAIDDPTIKQVNQLLDPKNPDNLWHELAQVSTTSQEIQGKLLRMDWDIFYPVESQEKLVELATNMWMQKELNITSVFAGKEMSEDCYCKIKLGLPLCLFIIIAAVNAYFTIFTLFKVSAAIYIHYRYHI